MAAPYIKREHSPIEHAPRVFNDSSSYTTSDTSTMATPTPANVPAPDSSDFCNGQGQDEAQASQPTQPAQHNGTQLDLLGRPVQKLVQLIKDLEQLGVETRNLPLPKIVVVGDQSAGKSSVRSIAFVYTQTI